MANEDNNGNDDTAAAEAAKAAETKFNTEVEARIAQRLPDEVKKALPDAVKAALPGVPEKYELTLPEKALITADDLVGIASIAKQLALPQDRAGTLVTVLDAHAKAVAAAQQKSLTDTVAKWGTEAAADEELGGKDGSKIAATTAVTDKFMTKFGTPELKEFLSKSGLGNHPALIRAFLRAGNAMKDDTIVITKDGGGSGGGGKKSTADKLYGDGTVIGQQKAAA